MEKITKSELAKIIKEEYTRAIRKQKLSLKLQNINEEISKLEEVEAGSEMNNGEVHDGQATPEFDLKGSHIVEGFEREINVKGDDIYVIDQKIGSFVNGEPVIDPTYSMANTPAVIAKAKALHSAPAIAECDNMPVDSSETEFEPVSNGEETEFTPAPSAEVEPEWIFEGKQRMLKLGGLLKDE